MIEVKHLNKTYDRRTKTANHVLRDISFTLPDRGFVCILGPSGCGKTSLLNSMGGLDVFDNGTLTVGDLSVNHYGARAFEAERNRNFGYIFQNYYLLENHSVAYNVYLGLHSLKLTHAEKLTRVRQALKAVDMERYIRRTVGELSGGQQQRVAIARALARRPRVIFADEPTGNLDEDNTRNICSLLRRASKNSLVIMVTHEERIARFFADRIITLESGRIVGDIESWQREDLDAGSDKRIYTEGLSAAQVSEDAVTLRLFQEPGAAPVSLTVAVLKNRIVLKLADSRAVTLGSSEEAPFLIDGPKPTVSLEEVEQGENAAQTALFQSAGAAQTRPGKGVTFPMMFQEARQLKKEKNLRRAGMRVFLILLTMLALLTVGDFIALSKIDPEDFITTDSHILTLTIEQGAEVNADQATILNQQHQFLRELAASGQDFDFVPPVSARMSYAVTVFTQMGSESLRFPMTFSYAPITRLDESSLIAGRMPEDSREIVVDRRVLQAMVDTGTSIVQNGIKDMSYFLNAELSVESRSYSPVIVGICDSGERSVYVSKSAMLALRNGSVNVMTLSEVQKLYPGYYDDIALEGNECLVNLTQAGDIWAKQIGGNYIIGSSHFYYIVKSAIRLKDTDYAAIVVADSQLDELLLTGITTGSVNLYCQDKAAMQDYLRQKVLEDNSTSMIVGISDPYQFQYNQYVRAAHIRVDARSIITVTVLVVCLSMLYLLCRTQAQGRIELLAVYRLLGIPKQKLYIIFLLEGILSALTAIIPAALLTWAAISALNTLPEAEIAVILPWQIAVPVSLGILAYYLLVSVLPLVMLLRLPPAQLAAKYDM